jgi:hypothetical protein
MIFCIPSNFKAFFYNKVLFTLKLFALLRKNKIFHFDFWLKIVSVFPDS